MNDINDEKSSELFFNKLFNLFNSYLENKSIFYLQDDFKIRFKKYYPVLNSILSNEGIVYGGFLRDLFCNKEPKDIDCCFFTFNSFYKFIDELTEDLDSGIFLSKKIVKSEYGNVPLNKIYLNKQKINLDVLNFKNEFKSEPNTGLIRFNTVHLPDVNINRLCIKYTGNFFGPILDLGVYTSTEQKLKEICLDIQNNQFTPEKNCPSIRINKLIEKGFDYNPLALIRDIIE